MNKTDSYSTENNHTLPTYTDFLENRKCKRSNLFDIRWMESKRSEDLFPHNFYQQQSVSSSSKDLSNVFKRMRQMLGIRGKLKSLYNCYNKNQDILKKVSEDPRRILMTYEEEVEYYQNIYNYPFFKKEGLEQY